MEMGYANGYYKLLYSARAVLSFPTGKGLKYA
jgi:hypothetical protein